MPSRDDFFQKWHSAILVQKSQHTRFPIPFKKILKSQVFCAPDGMLVILLSKAKSPSLNGLVLI
jgi:hypothetical protein